jgi:hypothetical protein
MGSRTSGTAGFHNERSARSWGPLVEPLFFRFGQISGIQPCRASGHQWTKKRIDQIRDLFDQGIVTNDVFYYDLVIKFMTSLEDTKHLHHLKCTQIMDLPDNNFNIRDLSNSRSALVVFSLLPAFAKSVACCFDIPALVSSRHWVLPKP